MLYVWIDGGSDGPWDSTKGSLHFLKPIISRGSHGAQHVPHSEMGTFNNAFVFSISDCGRYCFDAIALQ